MWLGECECVCVCYPEISFWILPRDFGLSIRQSTHIQVFFVPLCRAQAHNRLMCKAIKSPLSLNHSDVGRSNTEKSDEFSRLAWVFHYKSIPRNHHRQTFLRVHYHSFTLNKSKRSIITATFIGLNATDYLFAECITSDNEYRLQQPRIKKARRKTFEIWIIFSLEQQKKQDVWHVRLKNECPTEWCSNTKQHNFRRIRSN